MHSFFNQIPFPSAIALWLPWQLSRHSSTPTSHYSPTSFTATSTSTPVLDKSVSENALCVGLPFSSAVVEYSSFPTPRHSATRYIHKIQRPCTTKTNTRWIALKILQWIKQSGSVPNRAYRALSESSLHVSSRPTWSISSPNVNSWQHALTSDDIFEVHLYGWSSPISFRRSRRSQAQT